MEISGLKSFASALWSKVGVRAVVCTLFLEQSLISPRKVLLLISRGIPSTDLSPACGEKVQMQIFASGFFGFGFLFVFVFALGCLAERGGESRKVRKYPPRGNDQATVPSPPFSRDLGVHPPAPGVFFKSLDSNHSFRVGSSHLNPHIPGWPALRGFLQQHVDLLAPLIPQCLPLRSPDHTGRGHLRKPAGLHCEPGGRALSTTQSVGFGSDTVAVFESCGWCHSLFLLVCCVKPTLTAL